MQDTTQETTDQCAPQKGTSPENEPQGMAYSLGHAEPRMKGDGIFVLIQICSGPKMKCLDRNQSIATKLKDRDVN